MYGDFPIRCFFGNKVCLVGVSHIYKDSDRIIRKIFEEYKPDILALELDRGRLDYILRVYVDKLEGKTPEEFENAVKEIYKNNNKKKVTDKSMDTLKTGRVPESTVYGAISQLQRKIGEIFGSVPGMEMITAVYMAKRKGIPIYPIDNNIESLIYSDNNELIEILTGNPENSAENKEEIDIDGIEDILESLSNEDRMRELLDLIHYSCPGLFKQLIEERNKNMYIKIKELLRSNPTHKILVLVGAAHFPGISGYLEESL